MLYLLTKTYQDLPAAHRQHNHFGHCALIHGHNWRFDIAFQADQLDGNNFVIDVGRLGIIKTFLQDTFDHTLLLNEDDPLLEAMRNRNRGSAVSAKIVAVPSCSMEGLAKYVYGNVMALLSKHFPDDVANRDLKVSSVICWEDSKNSCFYTE